MRFALIASALVLIISAPAFAQDDYTEFVSKEDFFTISFPGKPVLTDGTWLTEYFVNLPSKVYAINGVTGKHTGARREGHKVPRGRGDVHRRRRHRLRLLEE
jgi:hypothetical protein